MIYLPLDVKDSLDKVWGVGGMVNWGPSLETNYHHLLSFLLLEIERAIRSQSEREKKRVRILLRVASNGARMLRFATLVP